MGLRNEILEQPAVVANLLSRQAGLVATVAGLILERAPRAVFLAARGSSDNAGTYAKYLWGAHNRLPVALAAPSLFSVYHAPPAIGDLLVVAISQSGQSPDIVSVVKEGRRQGALTLAITNGTSSPLARTAEVVLDVMAGEERSVAATKTYTAQLVAIAMLSAALAGKREETGWLSRLPGVMSEALSSEPAVAEAALRHRDMRSCAVLGRGFNYATAFEWALKLKELTQVVAEPYSPADFQHGPAALAEPGFPVLAVVPDGPSAEAVVPVIRTLVQQRGVGLLALSNHPAVRDLAPTAVALPEAVPEWLSPIPAIVPAQLFCYHLTLARGLDPERPRGLHKITRTL